VCLFDINKRVCTLGVCVCTSTYPPLHLTLLPCLYLRWRLFANREHNRRVMRQMHCLQFGDLQRAEALVKTSFVADRGRREVSRYWATLLYSKTLLKTVFRTWARHTYPPYELDWDTLEAERAESRLQMLQLPRLHPLSSLPLRLIRFAAARS
jgi:hypothetical protein